MAHEAEWLTLQKKIFGRYVEQRLREGGIRKEIKNIVEDFADGELIVQLITALSGQQPAKPFKVAKMRIQTIQNISEALDFAKHVGVDLAKVRVVPEDVVDKKENQVLAMIFQIIIRFLKFEEDEDGKAASLDVREALNLWIQNKTAGYKHIVIKDFTKSFHDGMPFLALVHKMRPKLIDYDVRSPEMADSNRQLALDLGEKYLNIPKYIEPSDIPKLNEISMIVYLSDWFAGVTLLQKQDVAARRVGKVAAVTELHDKLRVEYTERATKINTWLLATIEKLGDRTIDDTLAGIKAKLEAHYNYKKTEKAEKLTENLDAAAVFDNLAARLANHKRPAWKPSTGLAPAELEATFHTLEETESKRSAFLHTELGRQIHLHKLYKRYQGIVAKLNGWVAEKDAYIKGNPTINSVEDADDALDNLAIFEGELKHITSSAKTDLAKIAEELLKERFEHSGEVKSTSAAVETAFAGVNAAAQSKRAAFEAALAEQKALNEKLYKTFADLAHSFGAWIKEKRDALGADAKSTLDEQLVNAQKHAADSGAAEEKLAALEAANNSLLARELAQNPHTTVSLGDAQSQWAAFLVLVNKKIELIKEQIEDKKRGGLTPEQIKEIQENFKFFDKDGSNSLDKKEVRTCLQSLGEESTRQDIEKVFVEYDTAKAGSLTYADFERFISARLGDSDTDAEIIKSFNYLSYEKDTITVDQLKTVVNNRTFTDHHVEYLSKEIPAKDGALDFHQWTKDAFAR